MRPSTARAYLDGIVSASKFDQLVAPHLDARLIAGTLSYTRRSIDEWIECGGKGVVQTPEELARLLDHDDNPNS